VLNVHILHSMGSNSLQ